ncbi:MAG: hydrolase TatD, partial [Firmicutes bacterium]|nr:hydrolase TatD [Bacillota bacterium]
MRMIDSHAHLNDPAFTSDLPEVVARAHDAGVHIIINVGYDLPSSKRAVELAERYPGLWAVVGVHPHDA